MNQTQTRFGGAGLARASTLALVALLSSACTINPGLRNEMDRGDVPVPGIEVVHVTPEVVVSMSAAKADVPALDLSKLSSDSEDYVYRIGPGDVLQVVVWEHPELNNPSGTAQGGGAADGRLVAADGTMYFPYIGNVKAAGLTPRELRELVAQRLSKFIRDPQIDVRVSEFRSQRVYITGEVGNPSAIYLTDTVHGVLDAITGAGGFTNLSNRYRIQLTRNGTTTELPIGDLRHGDARANVSLRAGDMIHVPDVSNDKIFLLGEFNVQKTLVRDRSEISLAEALTQGGGLDKLGANASAIFVFRRKEGAVAPPAIASESKAAVVLPRVYLLDMRQAESLLLAEQFQLQPRDVVYVAATDFSKYNRLLAQLLPTVSAYFQLDALFGGGRR